MSNPKLILEVECSEKPVEFEVSWNISEADSSMWPTPLSIGISPVHRGTRSDDVPESDMWETIVDLSREDARVLRDFLTSMLASPDLRGETNHA